MNQRSERLPEHEWGAVTRWLIHHAAGRTPESLASRLEEEWFADVESRSSPLAKLRFAIGCCWASIVIAHDHPQPEVATARPAAGARGIIALPNRNFGYFSLGPGTLFLIVGIHAAALCGLLTTLSYPHGPAAGTGQRNDVSVPVEIKIVAVDVRR